MSCSANREANAAHAISLFRMLVVLRLIPGCFVLQPCRTNFLWLKAGAPTAARVGRLLIASAALFSAQ